MALGRRSYTGGTALDPRYPASFREASRVFYLYTSANDLYTEFPCTRKLFCIGSHEGAAEMNMVKFNLGFLHSDAHRESCGVFFVV